MCENSQYLRIHLFLDVMSYHGAAEHFWYICLFGKAIAGHCHPL
jgi:hypothetical protein